MVRNGGNRNETEILFQQADLALQLSATSSTAQIMASKPINKRKFVEKNTLSDPSADLDIGIKDGNNDRRSRVSNFSNGDSEQVLIDVDGGRINILPNECSVSLSSLRKPRRRSLVHNGRISQRSPTTSVTVFEAKDYDSGRNDIKELQHEALPAEINVLVPGPESNFKERQKGKAVIDSDLSIGDYKSQPNSALSDTVGVIEGFDQNLHRAPGLPTRDEERSLVNSRKKQKGGSMEYVVAISSRSIVGCSNYSSILDEVQSQREGIASDLCSRATQVESDELLARRLQEEFYHETVTFRSVEEIDTAIALSLQQEENILRLASRTGRSARHQRLDDAEALGAPYDDMNNLNLHHEFNENDYEALLALDKNNKKVGATKEQINSLSLSKVEKNTTEEACAVCLETPKTRSYIRHLPCLHKFHKKCIDKWLRRKTFCPVCKSDVFGGPAPPLLW